MRHGLSRTAGIVLLLALPSIAAAGQAGTVDGLSRTLKPGDQVTVVEWSGARTSGQVAEISTCSLAVVSAAKRVEIPASATKKVKLWPRVERPGFPDAGARCHNASCMAVALTFGGANAVKRLFSRAKTVYRARSEFPC
jgi:hypothetical protein